MFDKQSPNVTDAGIISIPITSKLRCVAQNIKNFNSELYSVYPGNSKLRNSIIMKKQSS